LFGSNLGAFGDAFLSVGLGLGGGVEAGYAGRAGPKKSALG